MSLKEQGVTLATITFVATLIQTTLAQNVTILQLTNKGMGPWLCNTQELGTAFVDVRSIRHWLKKAKLWPCLFRRSFTIYKNIARTETCRELLETLEGYIKTAESRLDQDVMKLTKFLSGSDKC